MYLKFNYSRSKALGFSLIELLTVVGVMAILATLLVFREPSPEASLKTAQRITASMLATTRRFAILKGQKARLIINKDEFADDRSQFLRFMGIVYESPNNPNQWIAANEGSFLPKNVYYIPRDLDGVNDQTKGGDMALSDEAKVMKIVYPKLSPQRESGPEWYYYEFDANGMADALTTANSTIVVYSAKPDAEGFPVVTNEFEAAGFRITPTGSVLIAKDIDDLQ